MPLTIEGATYYTAAEVFAEIGVTRQTFWRWRKEGKVPAGRRFRDGQVIFTESELQFARDYANRIELINPTAPHQLKLFNGSH